MASFSTQDGILTVQHRGESTRWRLAEILWLESSNQHTRVYADGGEPQVIRANLVSVEHWLPRAQFWRISRSVIVNRSRIRALEQKSHGDFLVVLDEGVRLAGSRNCRNGMPGR